MIDECVGKLISWVRYCEIRRYRQTTEYQLAYWSARLSARIAMWLRPDLRKGR